jgi:hypothetical protein
VAPDTRNNEITASDMIFDFMDVFGGFVQTFEGMRVF